MGRKFCRVKDALTHPQATMSRKKKKPEGAFFKFFTQIQSKKAKITENKLRNLCLCN